MSQGQAADGTATAVGEGDKAPSPAYRYYVLAILVFVYMLNFVDRQIIGILAAPLKEHLQMSDSQFGLLGGIAFASVYSTLAIPLAWLADRTSRVWIMTGALAVWSGFTALCGIAGSFGQLFLFRMGVGVGEAGGVAPAYSLIADYFPPNQRARAMAAFAFGIPLGTAGGTLIGGLLAAKYGWQTAFIVVGVLGVLIAPILRMTVRDPKRGGTDAPLAGVAATPARVAPYASNPFEVPEDTGLGKKVALASFGIGGVFAALGVLSLMGIGVQNPVIPFFGTGLMTVIGISLWIAKSTGNVIMKKKSFWLLSLGAASSSVCGYGVAGWLPLFFMRSFNLTLSQVSWYYAGIALIGGLLGIWMGGAVADKMAKRSKSAYPLVPAVAFIISAPCFILAMNSPAIIGMLPGGGSAGLALVIAFLIFLIPTGLNLAWLGPITAAVQHLAPAPMRSTASAIFLLINNLLGLAVGFFYFGWMSDVLRPTFGDESLRWAIYTGMGFYLMASVLHFCASRTLPKDWTD
ncbi:spinster family MFS transporter [Brevundimonas pishanensis]|uniref:spinster family MFS transporter n=1 Tax=Brevundimonas pishanensis TaxID=2896315 RepID=UPI001FA720AA|nr:MFS transporter [Brevundimonas pishanensis]